LGTGSRIIAANKERILVLPGRLNRPRFDTADLKISPVHNNFKMGTLSSYEGQLMEYQLKAKK
jgi:hypothetical protein